MLRRQNRNTVRYSINLLSDTYIPPMDLGQPDPAGGKRGAYQSQISSSGTVAYTLAQGIRLKSSKLSSETANWEIELPS